jgi:hypothetical protein
MMSDEIFGKGTLEDVEQTRLVVCITSGEFVV